MARHIGTANLKPIKDSERAKELQKKAAAKQRENIAKAKTFKAILEIMLEEVDEKSGKSNKEIVNEALLKQAKKGSLKAYEVLRDTTGQAPKTTQNIDLKTDNPLKNISSQELEKMISKMLK